VTIAYTQVRRLRQYRASCLVSRRARAVRLLMCVVVTGRNDIVAWGITNVGTDVQDLYELDTIDVNTYKHNGTVRAFLVVEVS
jgi:hypothetical protein